MQQPKKVRSKTTRTIKKKGASLDQLLTTYGVVHDQEAAPVVKPKRKKQTNPESMIIVQDKDRTHWSRFFSKADQPVTKVENKDQPVYTDKDLRLATKNTEKSLPPKLDHNVEIVRKFFLDELSPLTLAASAGIDQAQEVLQRVTDSDVDPAMGLVFKRLLIEGVKLRLAKFIVEYLKLSKADVPEILSILRPHKEPGIHFSIPPETPLGRPPEVKQNATEQKPYQQRRSRR